MKSPPDVITEADLEEEAEEMAETEEDQDQNRCASNSETMVNVITKTADSILVAKLTVN